MTDACCAVNSYALEARGYLDTGRRGDSRADECDASKTSDVAGLIESLRSRSAVNDEMQWSP
jgi:hypothetical protein